MHFFADPTKLVSPQTGTQVFGPLQGDETNKFRISSQHTVDASSPTKLFASQDSLMLILPTIDAVTKNPVANKVNLLLKPLDNLLINMQPVKYYIYRGVDRGAFLSGAAVIANNTSVNSEFINKLHYNWTQILPILGLAPGTPPDPRNFGFHDDLATNSTYRAYLVEEFFNSSSSTNTYIQDFAPIKVREGEWIGNALAGTSFEFEVMTDAETIPMDLEYAELDVFIVNATTHVIDPDAVETDDLAVREQVLDYIDPAAFFGMHYHAGVKITSGYTPTDPVNNNWNNNVQPDLRREQNLITDILSKFSNKDVVYLDIRSERGYSYGFYQNYRDNSDDILKLKSKSDLIFHSLDYKDMPWPLINLNNPPDNLNSITPGEPIYLKLSIRDNETPVLFAEDPELFGDKKKSRFLTRKELVDESLLGLDHYTNTVKLFVPSVTVSSVTSNVAWQIKLQYFREQDDAGSPDSVFKVANYLDSVFGGMNSLLLSIPNKFNHVQNTKRHFVKSSTFSFVTDTGFYFESGTVPLVTMYSELAYSQQASSNTYPKIPLTYSSNDGILQRKNAVYTKQQIIVSGTPIDLLALVGYNRIPHEVTPMENLHLLGLTGEQLDDILTSTTWLNDHQVYLRFDGGTMTDDSSKSYCKYKVIAMGLNNSLEVEELDTFGGSGIIYVYGSSPTMLCSEAFTAAKAVPYDLPDPGTMEPFPYVHRIEYTGKHKMVSSLFGGGDVSIDDNQFQNITAFDTVTRSFPYIAKPLTGLIGELFYPVDAPGSDKINTTQSSYPLIVICHGNGQRYSDYRELATHLAKNGFIVTSINVLAYLDIVAYEEVLISTYVFTPSLPTVVNKHLLINDIQDTLYIYDSSTDKLSVLTGGWLTFRVNYSWDEERVLGWKNGDEFETYIKPLSTTWTRTGTASATGITDFGMEWKTNSGPVGNRKADIKRMSTTARMVELSPGNWGLTTHSGIKAAIDGATNVSTIAVPYPSGTPVYIGTIVNGIYYMIEIDSTSEASGTVTLSVKVKNAQVKFNIHVGKHGMGIQGRANMVYPHIQIVKKYIDETFNMVSNPNPVTIENKIGLIGHSRGAEAVVRCATDIANATNIQRVTIPFGSTDPRAGSTDPWKFVPDDLFNVNAVISLAPTDQSGTGGPEQINGNIPYYVLFGSLDGDTRGCANRFNINRTGGFAIYDRSDGLANTSEKAMSYVYYATHNGFITDDHDYRGTVTKLDRSKQKKIAKAYMNAFMRMNLKDEAFWAPYFQGDSIPRSPMYEQIYPQYQNMAQPPGKWKYDFTGSTTGLLLNATSPTTSYSDKLAINSMFTLSTTGSEQTAPHDVIGLRVNWDTANKNLFVPVDTGGYDATGYDCLSFRIGHIILSPTVKTPTYQKLDGLIVRIYDNLSTPGTSERTIDREIPDPHWREWDDPWGSGRSIPMAKSAMRTVRLPLNTFVGTADLANVTKIEFIFPGTGSVLMHDIEFTD